MKFHFSFFILLLAGCASFRRTQRDMFIDDDGYLVHVEYGERSSPHRYKMVSPMNGRSIDCESKLMVRVQLPDEKWITCYFCQNDFTYGTMYSTDDGDWKYFTTGLECAVFRKDTRRNDYLIVYKGTACSDNGSKMGQTRNRR